MNVPYKYRGVLLLTLLAAVLPLAAWRYALGDTVAAWLECRRMRAELAESDAMQAFRTPDSGMSYGDRALAASARVPSVRPGDPELIFSGALLDAVRRAADSCGVQVTAYSPDATLREERTAIHTAHVTLCGDFAGLLRVADRIERTQPRCRLRTLSWQTVADPASRRRQLTMTLCVQQLLIRK